MAGGDGVVVLLVSSIIILITCCVSLGGMSLMIRPAVVAPRLAGSAAATAGSVAAVTLAVGPSSCSGVARTRLP
jgi:hypothetical protein